MHFVRLRFLWPSLLAAALLIASVTVVGAQQALSINETSLANGQVGVGYSAPLTVSGGVAPFTWSISSGNLPGQISINPATGTISGTPGAAGTSTFTVQVTDANGAMATRQFTVTMGSVNVVPISVVTASLPDASVGVAYSTTLTASGGTTPGVPYQWMLSSGSLPPGLALSTSGTISGTPTSGGDFQFTVQAADAAGNLASAPLSIAVAGGTTTTPFSAPQGTTGGTTSGPTGAASIGASSQSATAPQAAPAPASTGDGGYLSGSRTLATGFGLVGIALSVLFGGFEAIRRK